MISNKVFRKVLIGVVLSSIILSFGFSFASETLKNPVPVFRPLDSTLEPVPGLTKITTTSEPGVFQIYAAQPWQSSGFIVQTGNQYKITATGTWVSGSSFTPDGNSTSAPTNFSGPGLRAYSLIAKIGDNSPFYVGSNKSFTATSSGIIFFCMNDDPSILWDNSGSLSVTIAPEPVGQSNLTQAALGSDPLIDPRIYYYIAGKSSYDMWNVITPGGCSLNDDGQVNEPIDIWGGFWVRTKKDVNISFANKLVDPRRSKPLDTPVVEVPGGIKLTIGTGIFADNFISIPLSPYSNLPSDLLYVGTKWEKWVNGGGADYGYFSTYKNGNYTTIPASKGMEELRLAPGRAFWVSKESGGPTEIIITGTATPVNKWYRYSGWYYPQYSLKLPATQVNGGAVDGLGDHMIGNPYNFPITMEDIWIETPFNVNYTTGKIASDQESYYNDLKNLSCWEIGLKLTDVNGGLIDDSNRAGVIESGKDMHSIFNATDMVAPISDYIRLAFKDPEYSNSMLAWDYRAPGQDKYEWNIELSTSINSISTKLSLNNFKNIPAWYTVTLTDLQTGTVYPLSGDASFDVALTSVAPKNFILTASRQMSTDVNENVPVALKLKDIYPNPFNPATTISFDVKKAGNVVLSVYNISGQLVETLMNGNMSAGSHQVVWNAANHSSGVYIIRLTSNGFTDNKKVTFMK